MTTSISTQQHNFGQLKCSPTTLICREKTIILGDVTIGADCVLHPTVNIIARKGPIIIGNNNLIEERVNIINNRPEPLIIGDSNLFEVDAHCEALRVGNHNILESKSRVGKNIELTDNCVIGASCALPGEGFDEADSIEKIPSHTVIFGKDLNRRLVPKTSVPSSLSSQLDFLRKILPNYQKLWRPISSNLPSTPH